ncbi:MAG: V/A-type H+/Na+-transporting ATPase subunit [Candidatus Atribacteria bacterium]|nr:V/A-type H+/Na+-transporting ATPase subunit [Candidatus Atribacteria bacterium]MDI3530249.1 V/A-type H+/Na+-transporting ATPase subunit [Candidatus Atribacteria bacterium]
MMELKNQKAGRVFSVNGPVVIAEDLHGAKMYDMVKVGEKGLFGEIIGVEGNRVTIQVYEETAGIRPGEPVVSTYEPLSVELGPGLVGCIFDGTQRPLELIRESSGDFIARGVELPALRRDRKWEFKPLVKEGSEVQPGDILGEVQETTTIKHRIMVPPGIEGRVVEIKEGAFTVEEVIAVVEDKDGKSREIKMLQRWPVRTPRPYRKKLPLDEPLLTGQRVIDTFFPIAKGGVACIPGPFGSGKTVVQHQLAKWSNADLVVFIGCGERGNEMTDVLMEFPELIDPYTGEPLMKRTVLIANTSNMPVAAREASVYTGITIAEYYRDMGYSVALMADSTSRWAEAMREISGRLEEMPGEEGFPAYLGTRIASFYERAGKVQCLGSEGRSGSLSVIGAVSPPGGDLSEPVTQNTLRVVQVFWGLEDRLAYRRHFPAINWLISYSLYLQHLEEYWKREVAADFSSKRAEAMRILQQEAELEEIVRLVGVESLSSRERFILEIARSIREDFLQQNAFQEIDTYTSLKKQYLMLSTILVYYQEGMQAIEQGLPLKELLAIPARERIGRMKYVPEEELEKIERLAEEIRNQIREKLQGEVESNV